MCNFVSLRICCLCTILTTTAMIQKIFVKIPNMSFHENRAGEGRAVPCCRQTDRRVDGQIWIAPTWVRTPNRLARYLVKVPTYGLAHSESCYRYLRFQLDIGMVAFPVRLKFHIRTLDKMACKYANTVHRHMISGSTAHAQSLKKKPSDGQHSLTHLQRPEVNQ